MTTTNPVRYYSEACFLDRPWECTGVANPDAPAKHRKACHGTTHLPNF